MKRDGVRTPVWAALAVSLGLVAAVVALTVGSDFDARPAPPAAERTRDRSAARASAPGPSLASRPIAADAAREEEEGGPDAAALGRDAPEPEPPREDRRSASLVGLEREASRLVESTDFAAEVEARVDALEPIAGEPPEAFARRRAELRERLGSESFLLARRLRDLFAGVVYPVGFPVETVVAQERGWIETLPPEDREVMLRVELEDREDRELQRAEPQFEGFESAGEAANPDL